MEVVSREVRKRLIQKYPTHTDPRVKKARVYIESQIEKFIEQVVVPLGNDFDFKNLDKYWGIYREGCESRKIQPVIFNRPSQEQINQLIVLLNTDNIENLFSMGYTFLSDAYTTLNVYIREEMTKKRLETCFKSDNPVDWVKNFTPIEFDPLHKKIIENLGVLLQLKI